jgi:hypothetical protein
MIENISNLIVTAVAIIGAITVAIIAGLAIWTFRDIRSRSRDVLVQVLATVMVAVIPIAGILVYFMLRPRETLAEAYVRALEEESLLASIEHQEFCPSCGRRVDEDMCYCPTCHSKLRNNCHNCGRAVHLSWDLCPYCGVALQPETPVVRRPVQQRIAEPATKPVTNPLPSSAARSTNGLPAASQENTNGTNSENSSALTNVLDRIGGAIEGLVDRISSRAGGAQQEPPAEEQATPPPVRRSTPTSQTFSRPTPSASYDKSGSDSATSGKQPTSPIKPLISRDEPLE